MRLSELKFCSILYGYYALILWDKAGKLGNS